MIKNPHDHDQQSLGHGQESTLPYPECILRKILIH